MRTMRVGRLVTAAVAVVAAAGRRLPGGTAPCLPSVAAPTG